MISNSHGTALSGAMLVRRVARQHCHPGGRSRQIVLSSCQSSAVRRAVSVTAYAGSRSCSSRWNASPRCSSSSSSLTRGIMGDRTTESSIAKSQAGLAEHRLFSHAARGGCIAARPPGTHGGVKQGLEQGERKVLLRLL